MISSNLQTSIHLLNDLCADVKTFSYSTLAMLKLKGLTLQVNADDKELTIVISTEQDYQTIQFHLYPTRRMYQLLSIHFQKIHLVFGVQGEPIERGIYLETFPLENGCEYTELRDVNALGSRFRRIMNVALQGHIGVLKLCNDIEVEELRTLWERGRISQLIEKYGIIPFDDSRGRSVKLWKPRRLAIGEKPIIIIG